MTAMEKKETQELLDLMNKKLGEDGIRRLHETYGYNPTVKPMTNIWHRVLAGRAHHLAQRVIANGGTEEEVMRALQNLLVCLDPHKYRLDYKQFQIDADIQGLMEKYPMKKGV